LKEILGLVKQCDEKAPHSFIGLSREEESPIRPEEITHGEVGRGITYRIGVAD
jgi:hypothetical protein